VRSLTTTKLCRSLLNLSIENKKSRFFTISVLFIDRTLEGDRALDYYLEALSIANNLRDTYLKKVILKTIKQ
jgi:hypothetical protein